MVIRVKFTKNQLKVLSQFKDSANISFDKNMARRPDLYHECDRSSWCLGYVEAALEQLVKDGYGYLEG